MFSNHDIPAWVSGILIPMPMSPVTGHILTNMQNHAYESSGHPEYVKVKFPLCINTTPLRYRARKAAIYRQWVLMILRYIT
jgi:hypothetical protein